MKVVSDVEYNASDDMALYFPSAMRGIGDTVVNGWRTPTFGVFITLEAAKAACEDYLRGLISVERYQARGEEQ